MTTTNDLRRAQGDATLVVLILLTMSVLFLLLAIHLVDTTGPIPVIISSAAVLATVLVAVWLARANRRFNAALRDINRSPAEVAEDDRDLLIAAGVIPHQEPR